MMVIVKEVMIMAHEIEIYEDGILEKQYETENYILVVIEDNSVDCSGSLNANLIEEIGLLTALLGATEDLCKLVTERLIKMGDIHEVVNEEDPVETDYFAKTEELAETNRVEMTPEVIEAIVRQAKNRTERQKPATSTVRRTVVKMLLSLRRALSARS